LKLHLRGVFGEPIPTRAVGEADASWEATSTCTGREPRGRGPDEWAQNTGNNVGKVHLPAGIGDNLHGRGGIGLRSCREGGGLAHGLV
jgi:hypothetical protein